MKSCTKCDAPHVHVQCVRATTLHKSSNTAEVASSTISPSRSDAAGASTGDWCASVREAVEREMTAARDAAHRDDLPHATPDAALRDNDTADDNGTIVTEAPALAAADGRETPEVPHICLPRPLTGSSRPSRPLPLHRRRSLRRQWPESRPPPHPQQARGKSGKMQQCRNTSWSGRRCSLLSQLQISNLLALSCVVRV